VAKLDGGEYGAKKRFIGGNYGGQLIPIEIKKKTKGNFEEELQHPSKRN
jgi:hypothetical protein